MSSIVHGICDKHSHKNKTKSKKSKCRGWNTGWGYCSRMQKVTKQKKNHKKPDFVGSPAPRTGLGSFWDFFPSYYFPGWLNFSVTPQIQKQTVATGACLSQQSQNRTFLFSLPPPPSSRKSQSLGRCLHFCTVQPMQAWGFVT